MIRISKLKERVVYLTIDDFPSRSAEYGDVVLDLLKAHQVKATFFIIQYQVNSHAQNGKVLSRAIEEGHGFGNHMDRDTCYTKCCQEEFEQKLIDTEKTIEQFDPNFAVKKPKLFRPPHGKSNSKMRKVLKKNGYISILGDVYSLDPGYDTDPEIHSDVIVSNVKKGSIIILHTPETYMRTKTFAILENIIPRIKAKGFRFELLNDYFQNKEVK